MLECMQPFLNAIAKPELLKHQDQEVKLFVAACICEITRITAPEPPYDDDILKDSFQLTVSTFSGLSDTNAPSFERRVVILETLARYRSCVVMLDLECDDLINEMFTTLFSVARSLDLILERICIEGNRRQAKYAVHALASITKDDGLMSLSVLYKRLVDMLEEKVHLPSVLQSLGCIAQAAMPVFETRESEIEKFIKENILERGHATGDKAPDCWDDRSELCSLKISGVKALVKSYLPVKDTHLRSGIDDLIEILKNILSFGDISREIESSLVDKAHLKLTAAKSVLRLSKHWEHKIPIDVFYLTLRTSEDKFPEVKRIILNKIHQYVKDRTLDPKYACAFLLDISSRQLDSEENKRNLNDIIQMCRQGRGRQYSSHTDPNSPPLYPEYMLPYVVHSLARHPSFPNIDECKDAEAYEAMYRHLKWLWFVLQYLLMISSSSELTSVVSSGVQLFANCSHSFGCAKESFGSVVSLPSFVGEVRGSIRVCEQLYLFLSMLVCEEADSKTDVSITKDKETVSLLNSIFLCIQRSEDAFDAAKSKNSYALCDLGLSIVKRLAPKQDDPQDSSVSVILPSVLYKPVEKKEDNELLVGEEKTWLADDAVLAHFESLELEANGILQIDSALADDDIMKDSETEGSEVPLAKLMKWLKAKAAKARKEVKNESAPAGAANDNEFDILKMVKEINSNDPGTAGKPGSSNGPKYVYKKEKSSDKLEKRKSWFSKTMDVPVPKRRRTATTKGSNRPANMHQENIDVGREKMDEDHPTSSEKLPKKEKVAESAESDLLVSRGGKKSSSSSKQKSQQSDKDLTAALKNSPSAKKSKKVAEIDSPRSTSSSKAVSTKKQKQRTSLSKCTTKDNGSSTSVLIGRRIKVWWPLDKEFYEGVVKSFDSEKKKHVIEYDDGDVEVLSLEKERWELADIVIKSEVRSGSSKDFRAKGGSSGQKRKSTGGSERDEEPEVKPPSAKVRGKRTPRKSLNQKQKGVLKGKSTTESGESQDAEHPEPTTKSKLDHSDSG
ncbi:sister chromatid cohesion protein pds5 homolog b-b [Phtheirospermum japonicum]|uniref:Sister chromatid cohesion protein pds5 homolog b-b n=1 Tax=Phtheirospermum japonicum TaxID=374723 RepID=A0A830CGL3_9LAMI|nr:sister chromatid cohesion protein pds5 homolog b-b [Phtheirospermum japonicum]